MNTLTSDKLRIIKIIEGKCRKEGRDDFEFHQAHYSRRAGKMEITKMNLIKFALTSEAGASEVEIRN
jgi:hypothetical protein